MDDHYLVLRNLGYREHRLNEEVRVCLDYKCGGLDKIAADEGVNTIDCLGGEFATYEKHKQNLSMLQSEIEGRVMGQFVIVLEINRQNLFLTNSNSNV